MIHRIFNSVLKYDCLALTLVLTATYFSIVLSFDYLQNLSHTMYWSPDSRTYRAVGDWLFGIENTNATIIRPFFYPLMMNLSRSFAGIYGIWCYQFLLWILSSVLLYQAIKKVTNNMVLAIAGVFIFASNLTLLILTLHALAEVTVTFLITILIALIVNKQKYEVVYYWLLVIFTVSLLTVTKPVYMTLLLVLLIYLIPVVIIDTKKRKRKLRFLVYIALALSPVLVQLSIMQVKHNEFTISKVGSMTAKSYFLAAVYGEVNEITVHRAREHISSFDQNETFGYLYENYEASLNVYFRTVRGNIWGESSFINHPNKHTHLYNYMKIINEAYFHLHFLMMLPSVIVLIGLFKKRSLVNLEIVLCLMIPMYLIILSSGISFWQGDRLVVPSVPLWIMLYSLILSMFWRLVRESHLTTRRA